MTALPAESGGARGVTAALRRCIPIAAAALFATIPLADALAQSGAPLRLTPPDRPAQPTVPEPSAVPPTPAERTGAGTVGGIVVQRLGELDTGAVGVLQPDRGGLAETVWQGSSRGLVADLMRRIPGGVANPPLRELLRRLLLTAAPLPPAGAGDVDGAVLAARARLLVRLGAATDADALIAAAGRQAVTGELAWAAFEARLLAGDAAAACSMVRARAGDLAAIDWQKALIFCQLVAEQSDQAQFGLSLLRERGVSGDALFFAIAEALAARQAPKLDAATPDSMTPLNLALLRLAWTAVPDGFLAGAPAGILAALARAPDLPPAERLAAAMRAEALGAIATEELRTLVGDLKVTKQELAAALTIASTEAPARALALLWHAGRAQDLPAARAEVLQRLWEVAAANGMTGTAARLAAPLLADIPPLAEFGWFAGSAARMALYAGDLPRALGWYDVVAAAASTDSVADGTATALWPLLRLALGDVRRESAPATPTEPAPPVTVIAGGTAPAQPAGAPIVPLRVLGAVAMPWDRAKLERWLAADAARDRATAPQRAQRMLALLDAAGDPVPGDAWRAGLPAPAAAASSFDVGDPAYRLGLDRAASAGRQGETVLFAAAAIGGRTGTAVDSAVLQAVVRALARSGFAEAARAVALDGALAAGL